MFLTTNLSSRNVSTQQTPPTDMYTAITEAVKNKDKKRCGEILETLGQHPYLVEHGTVAMKKYVKMAINIWVGPQVDESQLLDYVIQQKMGLNMVLLFLCGSRPRKG